MQTTTPGWIRHPLLDAAGATSTVPALQLEETRTPRVAPKTAQPPLERHGHHWPRPRPAGTGGGGAACFGAADCGGGGGESVTEPTNL